MHVAGFSQGLVAWIDQISNSHISDGCDLFLYYLSVSVFLYIYAIEHGFSDYGS